MIRLAVDTGGTFTDIVGSFDGQPLHLKLPSTPTDPGEAILAGIEEFTQTLDRPVDVVLHGTTVGTNALLERRGAKVVLVTNAGFEDLLLLGRQTRPELFALHPEVPESLVPREQVVGVAGRLGPKGEEIEPLEDLTAWGERHHSVLAGAEAFAVCLLHSYASSEQEDRVGAFLTAAFPETPLTLSSALVPLAREFERAQTTAANAFLTPVIEAYITALQARLAPASLRVMGSSGGVLPVLRVVAAPVRTALSGPAGGVRGAAAVGLRNGRCSLLSLDMGGTSTDISVLTGEPRPRDEGQVGPLTLRTPLLPIETIGSGGGSIASLDSAGGLTVGPRSAGALPGPAAYGKGGVEPTVTDAHACLGRLKTLLGGTFPLDAEAATGSLIPLVNQLGCTPAEVATGILDVTNASIARACKRVCMERGYDPRDLTLVAFGGAGGLHACEVAEELGCRDVLFPREPGLLSAEGILHAPLEASVVSSAHLREALWEEALSPLINTALRSVLERFDHDFGDLPPTALHCEIHLDLRYDGQTFTLPVLLSEMAADQSPEGLSSWLKGVAALPATVRAHFTAAHRQHYGYTLKEDHPLMLVSLRAFCRQPAPSSPPSGEEPAPKTSSWTGPTTVEAYSATLYLPEGWRATLEPGGDILCAPPPRSMEARPKTGPLPLAMEVHRQRLESIAEEMGTALMRASFSANIKERRDFSCALFDRHGEMLAHAAHIPVHVGSQPLSVAAARRAVPMAPDLTVIHNDPFDGGTHLPDVTLITPVYSDPPAPHAMPLFFASNRAHHADVGGITPGSIPSPIDREGNVLPLTIEDEGIRIPPTPLTEGLRVRFATASRTPEERLGDLRAQEAANHVGARRLRELHRGTSPEQMALQNGALLDYTERSMREILRGLPDGTYHFTDYLDDGGPNNGQVPVPVFITLHGDEAIVDFRDAPDAMPSSLNAVRAITVAAVFYVFRCLGDRTLPSNAGLLRPITLLTRPGSICDAIAPAAVSAGNVETSQRLVDALFGALAQAVPERIPAASAGSMNNVLFGGSFPPGDVRGPGRFVHYETLAGGAGAGPDGAGAHGIHTHMTNTQNTPVEELERLFPVRITTYALRPRPKTPRDRFPGGRGVIRHYRFLTPCEVSVVSERRHHPPYGLLGGSPGLCGRNTLRSPDGSTVLLKGKARLLVQPGDTLCVETPGGGNFGEFPP